MSAISRVKMQILEDVFFTKTLQKRLRQFVTMRTRMKHVDSGLFVRNSDETVLFKFSEMR